MYILKNALRCISRAKSRNALIGLIALVIAVAACLGLSIRQAAESAKAGTMDMLSVTATISYDRKNVMSGMGGGNRNPGSFDRDEFANMMAGASGLTLEEYEKYAAASTVKSFYYTLTASFNGGEGLDPVTTETEEDSSGGGQGGFDFGGMFPGMGGNMPGNIFGGTMVTGDFSIIGYSSEEAMTDFAAGNASVTEGVVFTEGGEAPECIISEELANFNGINVGDTITIVNPSSEEELYTLTVTGIYSSSVAEDLNAMFSTSQDPANRIYMSAAALQAIINSSEAVSETVTDENGRETETAVTATVSGTYVFANTADYYTFEEEVYTLGLSDSYTVSSADLTAYESSLTPLNTLSEMAGWFLVVILVIGAVILVVLNVFNVRERKYEIGVLTAMGMKKGKVAAQFMTEVLVVTMAAILVGALVGAVSSVPVTNALLASQVQSQQNTQQRQEGAFGRGDMQIPDDIPNMGGGGGGMFPGMGGGFDFGQQFGDFVEGTANYITEVDSAMNLTVVLQMIGIGLLLTLIASAFSVMFVMRYDPLKILANRD